MPLQTSDAGFVMSSFSFRNSLFCAISAAAFSQGLVAHAEEDDALKMDEVVVSASRSAVPVSQLGDTKRKTP